MCENKSNMYLQDFTGILSGQRLNDIAWEADSPV